MKPAYPDIIKRLGKPLWYDEFGVPRYDPFRPELCSPYSEWVALLRVRCQVCSQEFLVAQSSSSVFMHQWDQRRESFFPDRRSAGAFHYGDPPSHRQPGGERCMGETMNSTPLEVVEFWERDRSCGKWVRRRDLRGRISGEA